MACDVMNPDDDYSDRKIYIEIDYYSEVEDITENFSKKVKREKVKLISFKEGIDEMYKDCSYTNIQDLECVNSVKVIACKNQATVKVSTKFLSAKLLINAKIFLASFVYDHIDTFCTPSDETKKIYNQNKIIKVIPYLLMIDTNVMMLQTAN